MDNRSFAPAGHIEDQINPHWVTTVFSVIGYIVCTLMGSASSITSLWRMIRQKKLWRSYWSTILLLTTSVFVSLIVVPLEVTQMTMHFYNSSTYILCDIQFFSMVMSQVLAFTCTLTIAVSRMRKIHSGFQVIIQDLPERTAVIISWIICFPIAGTLSYGSHTRKFTILPYEYCLRVKYSLLEDTQTSNQNSLNLVLPVTILTFLVCLIAVYMKGVLHIKKRMSISPIVNYQNMSVIKTISDRKMQTPVESFSLKKENSPCSSSEITEETFFSKSADEISLGKKMSTATNWNVSKSPLFLVPRESMSSTDFVNSTTSSFTYSSSPQSRQTSFASIDTTSDNVNSRTSMRKARKSQYSISKALRKASTVSMLSIETIPESSNSLDEDSPQLLHPLRHTRRSASNMWHHSNENIQEQKSHRSTNSKKGKNRKSCSQNSQGSVDSSSYSISEMTSDTDVSSYKNVHSLMLQRLKRQYSLSSITSDATHNTDSIMDDGDLQNTNMDTFDMFPQDIAESVDKTDNKTVETKGTKLSSTSEPSLPSQKGKLISCSQSVCSQELGEDDKNCDNVSTVDSVTFRKPLPPINSKQHDNDNSQDIKTLDNSQISKSSLIHKWGRAQPKIKMFRRSQSLINFSVNTPVSYFKSYEVETPQKSLPIKKTFADQMTQTEAILNDISSKEKIDEIKDIMQEQGLDSVSKQNLQQQQQQRPMIRIIRPSLPQRAQQLDQTSIGKSRQILMNNWCPPDLNRSSSVQFMEPTGNRGSLDRGYTDLHRGSIWSSRSAFLTNRYEMDVKRVFKRSFLLISAYMVCFLPTAILYLTSVFIHENTIVNLYAISRVLECSYFTAVPFLYVYTNASLMKLIHKKQK